MGAVTGGHSSSWLHGMPLRRAFYDMVGDMNRYPLFLTLSVLLVAGCDPAANVKLDTPPPATSASEVPSNPPTDSTPAPKPVTKPSGPQRGSVGYVGHLSSTGPHVPICVEPDDVSTITRGDRDGMMDLLRNDRLFSADGGAKVKVLAKKWAGLVKVRVLEGESEGREGWLPDEIVH